MAERDDAGLATFAVVGRVNKGKSSIVSTFTEDDSVQVDRQPGTTRRCTTYRLRVRGHTLFTIVDTPGFEDAEAVLAWLQQQAGSASERSEVVARFVKTFEGGERFREECELLRPILAGAVILYVVDASRPYRRNYEAEMEVLRWTGRPRMALVNRIGSGDHADEWRRALDQYFSLVREFDAHRSGFEERLALLRAFRELDSTNSASLDEAIETMQSDRAAKQREAAGIIAELLVDAVSMTIERPAEELADRDRLRARWHGELSDALRERERRARREIELLYRHDTLEREESPLPDDAMTGDLFAHETWRVLGLDQWQLARAGAVGGAAVGGTLDVVTGGTSFLAGTLIGGVVGGLTSYFGASTAAQVEIIGRPIGGRVAVVGPIKGPNFGWLLLDRALLHARSVAARAHAVRAPLVLGAENGGKVGPASEMDRPLRDRLGALLARARKGAGADRAALVSEIAGEIDPLIHR